MRDEPYYNGPLDTPGQVETALRHSCIESTAWNVEILEQAIRTARSMAGCFSDPA